jgi:hypothetical protein
MNNNNNNNNNYASNGTTTSVQQYLVPFLYTDTLSEARRFFSLRLITSYFELFKSPPKGTCPRVVGLGSFPALGDTASALRFWGLGA